MPRTSHGQQISFRETKDRRQVRKASCRALSQSGPPALSSGPVWWDAMDRSGEPGQEGTLRHREFPPGIAPGAAAWRLRGAEPRPMSGTVSPHLRDSRGGTWLLAPHSILHLPSHPQTIIFLGGCRGQASRSHQQAWHLGCLVGLRPLIPTLAMLSLGLTDPVPSRSSTRQVFKLLSSES